MENELLTRKAHLLTLAENKIKFLKENIEYEFISIKCEDASNSCRTTGIEKELAKNMFLFLENEYLKEIQQLKDEMREILNNENK